jgi:CheY-like chemotaxis protein
MNDEVTILIVEDDDGHATLIKRNLKRAGIINELVHFADGKEVLDYLIRDDREAGKAYLLLLDIRMPKVDGIEVLRRVKADPELKKIPVIMITTTDDPREVEKCHALGCSSYITKPIDYEKFMDVIKQLGLFLLVVQVPTIDENTH